MWIEVLLTGLLHVGPLAIMLGVQVRAERRKFPVGPRTAGRR